VKYLMKIQLAETLSNIVEDVLSGYCKQYGSVPEWDMTTLKMFCVNSDVEIFNFLKKNDIEWNQNIEGLGPTYIITAIKTNILTSYFEKYDSKLDVYLKKEMFFKINTMIYDSIINGLDYDY